MSPENQHNSDLGGRPPIDRDLLISRVVDDAASASDWDQLRSLAEYDSSVWRELFEAQRAQAELAQAVEQAIAIADEIDAPIEHLPQHGMRLRFRQVAQWGGWALAASVAIAFVATNLAGPSSSGVPANEAGIMPPIALGNGVQGAGSNAPSGFIASPPRQLPLVGTPPTQSPYAGDPFRMASTREQGRSEQLGEQLAEQIGEMPDRVLLEVRRRADGKLELVYVRRLIERAVVNESDLYKVKPDDAGIERTVPYRQRQPSSGPI